MTSQTYDYDLMKILVGNIGDPDYARQPVIVQGMTGSFGSVHTKLMRDYGTNIVYTSGIDGASPTDAQIDSFLTQFSKLTRSLFAICTKLKIFSSCNCVY